MAFALPPEKTRLKMVVLRASGVVAAAAAPSALAWPLKTSGVSRKRVVFSKVRPMVVRAGTGTGGGGGGVGGGDAVAWVGRGLMAGLEGGSVAVGVVLVGSERGCVTVSDGCVDGNDGRKTINCNPNAKRNRKDYLL